MTHVHSLISDMELEIELLQNIKNRDIDQKHTYLNDGAEVFYASTTAPKEHLGGGRVKVNIQEFVENTNLTKGEHAAIISLGCGNGSQEYGLLKALVEEGYLITYIGVDISKRMLEMAEEYLEDIPCTKQFICADFASPFFRSELNTITNTFDKRIFAFIGSTIGNILLTNIVDTLSNMVTPKDYLWLDVIARNNTSQEGDLELFTHYSKYLDNPLEVASFFYPLRRLGLTLDDGKMNIAMYKEDAVGILRFEFRFTISRKVRISLRNERLVLLPKETIKLCDIRAYDVPKLIAFFEERDFQCLASENNNKITQMYFQMKSQH